MKIENPATRSLLAILALALTGGLAALVLQAASSAAPPRSDPGVCQASLSVYEDALNRAERAGAVEAGSATAVERQKAYEAYIECLRYFGMAGAAALQQTPPPTFPRPPFTPPGHMRTHPPVQPPRGTPNRTMTPPGRMLTPPGPMPTHERPPFTPPGPPMTPPGRMITPPR
jgi:amino acid permease-like protein